MSDGPAPLGLLLVSLLAAAVWLVCVWRKAGKGRPPLHLVAVAFVLGGLCPLGVFGVHGLLQRVEVPLVSSLTVAGNVFDRLAYFTVVVGLVEEAVLLVVVGGTVCRSRTFDSPVQGFVYSSAAALGFAAVENARYADVLGPDVLAGRAVLSTVGHVLISMVWGVALGLQRTGRGGPLKGWVGVGTALLLAAVLHGTYDTFLYERHVWPAVAMLVVLWGVFAVAARDAGVTVSPRPR